MGFALAYVFYLWLNPILEERRDWLRELQGLLFTALPIATALGAGLAWWLAGRIPRKRTPSRNKSDLPRQ